MYGQLLITCEEADGIERRRPNASPATKALPLTLMKINHAKSSNMQSLHDDHFIMPCMM